MAATGYWRRELGARIAGGDKVTASIVEQALAALEQMSPEQFEVVCLRLRGLDQGEIAARLGISQQAVSKRLSRAKSNLPGLIVRLLERKSAFRNIS